VEIRASRNANKRDFPALPLPLGRVSNVLQKHPKRKKAPGNAVFQKPGVRDLPSHSLTYGSTHLILNLKIQTFRHRTKKTRQMAGFSLRSGFRQAPFRNAL